MSERTIRVIYVGDEDRTVADDLETADGRLEVDRASDPEAILERCRATDVDAVIVSSTLPDNGVPVIETLRAARPALPVVHFCDADDDRVAARAVAAGVSEYVPRRDGVSRLAERLRAVVDPVVEQSRTGDPLRRAMDAAPIGIVITDYRQSDNPIVYANAQFLEMTGYEASAVHGRNCRFLQGSETDEAAIAELRRAVETAEPTTVELRNYRADGTAFWNRVTLAPVRNVDGTVTHFVGFQEDVTERRRQTRERETTIELLRGIYDVTTDPALNFEAKIDQLLELGSDKLGLPYAFLSKIETREDSETGRQNIIQARGSHELLQPGESCPLSEAYCRRTIDTDGLLAVQDALAAGWEDDPAYHVFELGSYIGGKVVVDGDLYGTLCFAANEPRERPFTSGERTLVRLMSKWASYELERQQTRERLERQNERLEEFASIVSHDLRNPLNVAISRFQMLADDCDSEHVTAVEQAHDRMEALIEDLLTLAREGKSANDPEPVALATVVEDCWETVETAEATLSVETERTVRADSGQLRQLLENLVRNAIEHGREDVRITVGDLSDGFYVADDGPGIPPEDREQVLDSGFSTADDGTGYGLAIVETIADAHDWAVVVTESEHGGARFEFTGVEFV